MLETRILIWRRSMPEPDADALPVNISDRDWPAVERAVAWLAEASGEAWGRSIPAVTIKRRNGCVATPTKVNRVLAILAAACRYGSGDSVYARDCPEFAAVFIHRS